LLAVLRCCADDPDSLFSAARAHSRLHQAAVLAASSISAGLLRQQDHNRMMQYLRKYGQHVSSLDLYSCIDMRLTSPFNVDDTIILRELPHDELQGLSSLSCSSIYLQLQPRNGSQGILGPALTLKQLRLNECRLLDGDQGLTAALLLLTDLQHLSLVQGSSGNGTLLRFPVSIQQMQQLTFLELHCMMPRQQPDGLQHLQGLTRLQVLRLQCLGAHTVQATMLSGMQQLSHLQVHGAPNHGGTTFEPCALAGRTQLQHLEVLSCKTVGGAAGDAELLSHLQHMQQLTHLNLSCTLCSVSPSNAAAGSSAAAYSALTASSKLQRLNIGDCTVPTGGWQHMFPAGRQLPHLHVLSISGPLDHPGAYVGPEGSRLVSSCPGLQKLSIVGLQYSAELLAPLQGLSGLQALEVGPVCLAESMGLVCQLSGLRKLITWDCSEGEGLLLQLTQLKQLTHLEYMTKDGRTHHTWQTSCEVRV
jgi:hypothetical protein